MQKNDITFLHERSRKERDMSQNEDLYAAYTSLQAAKEYLLRVKQEIVVILEGVIHVPAWCAMLADNLKLLRAIHFMTVEKLNTATFLGRNTLGKLESGVRTSPNSAANTLLAIAAYFKVRPTTLMRSDFVERIQEVVLREIAVMDKETFHVEKGESAKEYRRRSSESLSCGHLIRTDLKLRSMSFSTRALNSLDSARIRSIRNLCSLNREDLQKIQGLGKSSIKKIVATLAEQGLHLFGECPDQQ